MHFCDNPNASDLQRSLSVVRVRPGKQLPFLICQRQLVGVYTHWNGAATVACEGPETCSLCERSTAVWKGFVVGYQRQSQSYSLVQLTPAVVPELRAAHQPPDGLLGLTVNLRRLGSRRNSPLSIVLGMRLACPCEWPVARVREMVKLIFGTATSRRNPITS
jgi:hypothetical protein